MVGDGAFSHKTDYPEEHPNRSTGSKVTVILLNGWILLIGGVSSGRVCARSLRSSLVYVALADLVVKTIV